MFLKEIESRPPEGMMRIAFKKLREAGYAIPEIMHLFRFKKRNTDHLVKFTEEVMRGPSPLSRGMRELIGAFVSTRNQCCFCRCAHVAVAAQLLGQELVDQVLTDSENSSLDLAHKELFRYIGKLADNPASITASDVERVKEAGCSEETIYDALTVASLFKFYNTWNNGAGVLNMGAEDYLHAGERLTSMGYCMDFNLKGTMKVMWVGRKEINHRDLHGLLKITLDKCAGVVRVGFLKARGKRSEPVRSAQAKSASAPAAACRIPGLDNG